MAHSARATAKYFLWITSCNPVKSPVNCGYHLPHFRDGDLNPGSSDNLPRSPQVVGSAGFDPRQHDTTAPYCDLRWRVKQILAVASCAITFWKRVKTPVEMRFVPEWKWGRYWSRKHTFQRLVCLFTDPPGQLGCDCEQGHRPMAQTLREPGPLRLNVPDVVDSLPGLPRGLFWDMIY